MSVQWNRLAALAITGCVTLGVASDAHADRRSSLNGNLLIEDVDDVYFYPQLALEYRNLVSFDYYPGASLTGIIGGQGSDETAAPAQGEQAMGGGGLLLFGDENFAFGISSHRQDVFGSTVHGFLGAGDLYTYGPAANQAWSYFGYNSPLPPALSDTPNVGDAAGPNSNFLTPLQMVDLLLAFRLAPDHSLGFRLSVGQNNASVEVDAPGLTEKDSWNTTAINLTAGYSVRSNIKLDVNLELGLGFFSNGFETTQNNEPNYADSGTFLPSFTLSNRTLVPLQENIELGVVGIIHVNSSSVTNENGVSPQSSTTPLEYTEDSTNFFIEAGAGPVYTLPDNTTIAAYGTLGFGYSSYSLDGGDRDISSTSLLLPGFKLALEHWLWDWMAFRSGLTSRYHFQSQAQTFSDENTPNVSGSANHYEFLWSVGVGIKLGNFELNGTLQTPFVTDGPAVLGGNSTGLFSLLNAQYKF